MQNENSYQSGCVVIDHSPRSPFFSSYGIIFSESFLNELSILRYLGHFHVPTIIF